MSLIQSFSACLLGLAVHSLFPQTSPLRWRITDNSFLYDFFTPSFMKDEWLASIEEKIHQLRKTHFSTHSMMRENAVLFLQDKDQEILASMAAVMDMNLIEIIEADNFYQIGFHEIPEHIPAYITLLSSSCCYTDYPGVNTGHVWRISGTAFADKKEMARYKKTIQIAKQQDPLQLATSQKLLHTLNEHPVWLPKGMIVYQALQGIWECACSQLSLSPVKSVSQTRERKIRDPFDEDLFRCANSTESSHLFFLQQGFATAEIVNRQITLPQYEQNALFLSECFTSDTIRFTSSEAQLREKIIQFLDVATKLLQTLGLEVQRILLLPKQKRYHSYFSGLGELLEKRNKPIAGGGPRIELRCKDLRHKSWLVGFLELDTLLTQSMEQPVFAGSLLYSFERITALLLEKCNGFLPLMLTPIQLRLAPICHSVVPYIEELKNKLMKNQIRVDCDLRQIPIGKRLCDAYEEKIPCFIAIGDQEIKKGEASVRWLAHQDRVETVHIDQLEHIFLELSR